MAATASALGTILLVLEDESPRRPPRRFVAYSLDFSPSLVHSVSQIVPFMATDDKQTRDDDSGRRKAETEFVLVGLRGAGGYVLMRQSHLNRPDPHPLVGPALIVFAMGVLAGTGLAGHLWRRRLRRRVNRAFMQLGLTNAGDKKPRLRRVRREGPNV